MHTVIYRQDVIQLLLCCEKKQPPLGAVVDGAFFLHSDGFKEVMPYDHFQPLPR